VILNYVPLLQVQRDLYRIPRGGARFKAYLRTMIDPDTSDLRLPLTEMNPMGKEHIPRLIDDLLRQAGWDPRDKSQVATEVTSTPATGPSAVQMPSTAASAPPRRRGRPSCVSSASPALPCS